MTPWIRWFGFFWSCQLITTKTRSKFKDSKNTWSGLNVNILNPDARQYSYIFTVLNQIWGYISIKIINAIYKSHFAFSLSVKKKVILFIVYPVMSGNCFSSQYAEHLQWNRVMKIVSCPQESRIYAVAKSGIRLSEASCSDAASKGTTDRWELTDPCLSLRDLNQSLGLCRRAFSAVFLSCVCHVHVSHLQKHHDTSLHVSERGKRSITL